MDYTLFQVDLATNPRSCAHNLDTGPDYKNPEASEILATLSASSTVVGVHPPFEARNLVRSLGPLEKADF